MRKGSAQSKTKKNRTGIFLRFLFKLKFPKNGRVPNCCRKKGRWVYSWLVGCITQIVVQITQHKKKPNYPWQKKGIRTNRHPIYVLPHPSFTSFSVCCVLLQLLYTSLSFWDGSSRTKKGLFEPPVAYKEVTSNEFASACAAVKSNPHDLNQAGKQAGSLYY